MKESSIQKRCVAYCKTIGALAVKTDSTSSRGWPDLTVVLPNGIVLFIEMKTETGVLSKLQERMINKIKDNKGLAYVVKSETEFRELISRYTQGVV